MAQFNNLRFFNKKGYEIQTTMHLGTFTGSMKTETVSVGLTDAQTLVVLTQDSSGNFCSLFDSINHNFKYVVHSDTTDFSSASSVLSSYGIDFSNPVLCDDGTYSVEGIVSDINVTTRNTINTALNNASVSYECSAVLAESKRDVLLFYINTEDQEDLRFFNVKTDASGAYDMVEWTDKIMIDPNTDENVGVQFGFDASLEGQYINSIYVCRVTTEATDTDSFGDEDDIEKLGELIVYSSAVGDDERYRTLFHNFGIPDPITYLDVFKDSPVADGKPNYKKYDDKTDYIDLNEKSKTLFLSYSEIFPYVGTYKALVNAVDYLGYDDIYFKEWYKELSKSKYDKPVYTSYEIPYKSHGKNILKNVPIERRISLKKMNWLSMIYKINQELVDSNGEYVMEDYDKGTVGYMLGLQTPVIINNYENYSDKEILIKLVALKRWLEKYIIGINCRIIDINGEGIVYENLVYSIYGKTTVGTDYAKEKSISPYVTNEVDESMLIDGSCNLHVYLKELDKVFADAVGVVIDASGNLLPGIDSDDERYIAYKNRVDEFKSNYNNFLIKAYISTGNSAFSKYDASTGTGVVSQTILVHDGEIFFDPKNVESAYNKTESEFIVKPILQIEKANLRFSNVAWDEALAYTIEHTRDDGASYKLVDVRNNKTYTKRDYISLRPMVDASGNIIGSLKYTTDNLHNVPMFLVKNYNDFQIKNSDDNYVIDSNEYILEILDGKFIFNEKISDNTYRVTYLNFHFDTDSLEQSIEVNYVYDKQVDVVDNGCNVDYIFNDDYTINHNVLGDVMVKNIGEYRIRVFSFDEYNGIYSSVCWDTPCVYSINPTFTIYTDSSTSGNSEDFYRNEDGSLIDSSIFEYEYPLIRESYLMNDVSVLEYSDDEQGRKIEYATYPTLSYAVDTPDSGDIAHFMNITDNFAIKCDASGNGIIGFYDEVNEQYALFLDNNSAFNAYRIHNKIGDNLPEDVNLVFYDSLQEQMIFQCTTQVKLYDPSEYPDIDIYSVDKDGSILEHQTIDNGQPFVVISQETFNSLYMYYDGSVIDETTRYRYTEGGDTKYFYITPHIMTAQQIFSIISNSTIYKIFLQSRHELEIVDIHDCTEDVTGKEYYDADKNYISIKISNKHTATDGENLYKEGQLIRYRYVFDGSLNHVDTVSTKIRWSDMATYKIVEVVSYNTIVVEENMSNVINSINALSDDINIDDAESINNALTEYGIQMFIEHAHQAYVDYVFDVDHAKETIDGITELYVTDDEYMHYIDNTFAVLTKKFNVHNCYKDWIDETYLGGDNLWYSYNIPITINQPDSFEEEFGNAKYRSIVLMSDDESFDNTHNFWRIYKFDSDKNKNILYYEVWNNSVMLTPKEPGLYSVELFKYDDYGNLTSNLIVGAFKIM